MSFLWHGLTEQGAQVPVQVDAQGRVIAVDGTPGVSNWERTGTTLSPAVPGDSIAVGGNATFAGKVAIGTDSPGAWSTAADNLVIEDTAGEGGITIASSTTGGSNIFFADTDSTAPGQIKYQHAGDYMRFYTATIERFRIDSSGNVLIGGTLPSAPNISLNANGSIKAATDAGGDYNLQVFSNSLDFGKWSGDLTSSNGFRLYYGTSNALLSLSSAGGDSTTIAQFGPNITFRKSGSATFAGNITAPNVTFRSADPQFYVKKSKNKDAAPEYVGPELDLLAEIARLEALVRHLYETLRLAPPAGWPVWDGNDDVLRQLRK